MNQAGMARRRERLKEDVAAAARGEPRNDMMTTQEACAYMNLSKPTLINWARKYRISRLGANTRVVRWPKASLDKLKQLASKQSRGGRPKAKATDAA